MKYGLFSLVGGVVLVSVLMAQAPTPPAPPRTEGGQAPAEAQRTPPGPRDRVGPGVPDAGVRGRGFGGPFGPRTLTPPSQSGAQPERGSAGPTPAVAGPRNFPPLPEAGTAGKMLMLDVLIAETAEPLMQPTAAELLDLERKGKLKAGARVRLLSLENVPAFTQFGELANRVAGRATTGLAVTPIFNTVNVGTIVQATSRLEPDGTALVQIYVEKSAVAKSDLPPEVREPEAISRMLAQSTARVKPGEPVVLSAGPSNGSDAASQTWVVLTCSHYER